MNGNVTMIEDLPELDDIDRNRPLYARQNQLMPNQERMMQGTMDRERMGQDKIVNKYIRPSHNIRAEAGMQSYNDAPVEQFEPVQQLPQQQVHQEHFINCIDIVGHIQRCPICSKFYHDDKTVYIIAICVLLIICILLMKRVLNL